MSASGLNQVLWSVLLSQPRRAEPAKKTLFNDVAVPRVVVTQLAVWNCGNTVIKGNDIVESHPLTVCFEDAAVILNLQRMNATQEVNDFRIRISEQDRSRAFLEFD